MVGTFFVYWDLGEGFMKLKASVDYGVRAVLYLAARGTTCSSRDISEDMNVPRDYLIQLALKLRNAGIIKARPGKNGGYVLAKDPSKITICQIMDAFDNNLKHSRRPMKKKRTTDPAVAQVKEMHETVMESLNAYLNGITVQDLLDARDAETPFRLLIADSLEREAASIREEAEK